MSTDRKFQPTKVSQEYFSTISKKHTSKTMKSPLSTENSAKTFRQRKFSGKTNLLLQSNNSIKNNKSNQKNKKAQNIVLSLHKHSKQRNSFNPKLTYKKLEFNSSITQNYHSYAKNLTSKRSQNDKLIIQKSQVIKTEKPKYQLCQSSMVHQKSNFLPINQNDLNNLESVCRLQKMYQRCRSVLQSYQIKYQRLKEENRKLKLEKSKSYRKK